MIAEIEQYRGAFRTAFMDLAAAESVPSNINCGAYLSKEGELTFIVYRWGETYESGQGNTFPEAMQAMQKQHPTGAALIAKKREQAKALLAEAHQLETQIQS